MSTLEANRRLSSPNENFDPNREYFDDPDLHDERPERITLIGSPGAHELQDPSKCFQDQSSFGHESESATLVDSCNQLAGRFISEALERFDSTWSGHNGRVQLNPNNRKIFTSSSYYDDQRNSYPTLEQQVELSRSIASQLAESESEPAPTRVSPNSQLGRATEMFRRQRRRLGSASSDASAPATGNKQPHSANRSRRNSSSSSHRLHVYYPMGSPRLCLTDTEYEAPKVALNCKRPANFRLSSAPRTRPEAEAQVEVEAEAEAQVERGQPKLKPYLDSSCVKTIERLRKRQPAQEPFNEHDSVPAEVCFKLAQNLNQRAQTSQSSRNRPTDEQSSLLSHEPNTNPGVRLFERRQLESTDWIVSGPNRDVDDDDDEASGETGGRARAGECERVARQLSRASPSGETVMVVAEHEDEAEVMELATMVMSEWPQFKLVTVTKVPSFSASSRRVIECDSPDLLTSREDDELDDEPDDEPDVDVAGAQSFGFIDDNPNELAERPTPSAERNWQVAPTCEASAANFRSGQRSPATRSAERDYLAPISRQWKLERRASMQVSDDRWRAPTSDRVKPPEAARLETRAGRVKWADRSALGKLRSEHAVFE